MDVLNSTYNTPYYISIYILTLNAGMQTVRGYIKMYQPAQKPATKNDRKMRITSQMMNHSGFFILKACKTDRETLIRWIY